MLLPNSFKNKSFKNSICKNVNKKYGEYEKLVYKLCPNL